MIYILTVLTIGSITGIIYFSGDSKEETKCVKFSWRELIKKDEIVFTLLISVMIVGSLLPTVVGSNEVQNKIDYYISINE